MNSPTEPIGSAPWPPRVIEAFSTHDGNDPALGPLYQAAVRDTGDLRRLRLFSVL